jgi:hypothetical protein
MIPAMLLATLAAVAIATPPPAPVPPAAPPSSTGYPTEALADYVIGCMAANGQTQDALRRCSCSMDTIASVLPYDDYVKAQTVIAMRGQGESAPRSLPMCRNCGPWRKAARGAGGLISAASDLHPNGKT